MMVTACSKPEFESLLQERQAKRIGGRVGDAPPGHHLAHQLGKAEGEDDEIDAGQPQRRQRDPSVFFDSD